MADASNPAEGAPLAPAAAPATEAPKEPEAPADPAARFRGVGTSFKAKLIGVDEVLESRGDKMCQDSILKLKAAVKVAGQHKQKIIINVSLDGLKISDLVTGEVQYTHAVNRISFIARDLTDRRAFAYIYGAGDGKHQLFGIKTAKVAEQLVLTLRDLFQVVYDMKTKEMEAAKGAVKQDKEEAVYNVPNNRAVEQTQQQQQQGDNILNLQQQIDDMGQMSDLNAYSPWPENTPQSPPTPGSPTGSDMFGMQQPAGGVIERKSSYSNDLAALSIEAAQPASAPGAKMTKDQILAGFGPAPGQPGGFGAQPGGGMFMPQQPQVGAYYGQPAPQQQQMFGAGMAPPAAAPPANPFAGNMFTPPQQQQVPYQQQQPARSAPGIPSAGMYQSPAIPARPGAMSPPQPMLAQTGAAQNPFGDAAGAGLAPMAPLSSNAGAGGNEMADSKAAPDPFAELTGIGGGAGSNKDMFKNFQMAKPPQPPPRTGTDSVSSNFDNYMLNSVGGLPVSDAGAAPPPAAAGAPTPMPRNAQPPPQQPQAQAAFDAFNNFDQAFNFNSPQQQQQAPQQGGGSLFG